MRVGKNISKNKLLELSPCNHRVIIPLYIPEEEGYYKESFKIFVMCLKSLKKTSSSNLKISVVSNGSSVTVHEGLFKLQKEGFINELIIETEPIGKINSILKALRTAEERLITITDADVLFLNDWEDEVIKVFYAFPKAGMVSPVPVFRTQLRYTYNIWMRYLFSSRLKFRKVKNPKDMTRFANSLGWSYLSDKLKDVILTLKAKNNTLAVVGNSHFVGTYKREVFDEIPKINSIYKLGGDSERFYTDIPVIKSGGFKLATYDNFAYHIGNTLADWMEDTYGNLQRVEKKEINIKHIKSLKKNTSLYVLSEYIFKKIFMFKSIKKRLYINKGLTVSQSEDFIDGNFLDDDK